MTLGMDTFTNVEYVSCFLTSHQDMLEIIWSRNISPIPLHIRVHFVMLCWALGKL